MRSILLEIRRNTVPWSTTTTTDCLKHSGSVNNEFGWRTSSSDWAVAVIGRSMSASTDLNVVRGRVWCSNRSLTLNKYVVAEYVTASTATTAKSGSTTSTSDEENVCWATTLNDDWVDTLGGEGVYGVATSDRSRLCAKDRQALAGCINPA